MVSISQVSMPVVVMPLVVVLSLQSATVLTKIVLWLTVLVTWKPEAVDIYVRRQKYIPSPTVRL